LDAVRGAEVTDLRAKDVGLRVVEAALDAGYGVYGGGDVTQAVLRFSPVAAQWVANEQWHPKQTLETLDDGSLRMTLPYADDTELTMDLLRHGADVVVEAPPLLRDKVNERLRAAADRYR
jgi:predicted DNA-binding transcriptional regulator YafY